MPTIAEGGAVHTVIVTVDAEPGSMEPLVAHARAGLGLFGRWPGFLGGALHVSHDGGRLVQLVRWRSETEYRACIDDPAWEELPTTAPFFAAVRAGAATLDARGYRVVATAGNGVGGTEAAAGVAPAPATVPEAEPGGVDGAHVVVFSGAAEADRAFVRGVLGFAEVDAGGGWPIFALPPAEVAVHPAEETAGAAAPSPATELYLMTADLPTLRTTLAARGVETPEPRDAGWGLLTSVELPSGRRLGLYEPRRPTAIARVGDRWKGSEGP